MKTQTMSASQKYHMCVDSVRPENAVSAAVVSAEMHSAKCLLDW